MKKYILLTFIFLSSIFLIGCQDKNSQIINFEPKMEQKDIDRILLKPVKVTDPEILKELQFMKEEKMISEQFYEILIRMTSPQKIGERETYPGCYESFCDMVHSREDIQNIMKDKAEGKYDPRVYEISDDPQVQGELQFMKDYLNYNLSNISISIQGDYVEKYEREALITSRQGIQQTMELYHNRDKISEIQYEPILTQQELDFMLPFPIKIKNPDILKELQFMREQDMISEEFYQILLRTSIAHFMIGEVRVYPACYYNHCGSYHGRIGIQNLMKEQGVL